MAERIAPIQGISQVDRVQQVSRTGGAAAGQFGALLQRELGRTEPAISFSKHAQSRAAERGIQVDDTLMDQLADSVERTGDHHHVPGGDGGQYLHKYRRRCPVEMTERRTFLGCLGPLPD